MNTEIMTSDVNELDMADLEAVSGGALAAPLQKIVDMVGCVTHGGDWSDDGVSTLCSGPQG
jgi:hypothetical protein